MSESPLVRKVPPPVQSLGSERSVMTSRQPYTTEPIASKHVCFYKSGDAQFNGLPVVISSRTFNTFEALLDSLSKRVPLPFGVRTITTPRGRTTVRSLDQLHHGQSYICSDRRTVKPIDLERARHKPPPWYHARALSGRHHRAWQSQTRGRGPRPRPTSRGVRRNQHATLLQAPRRLVVVRNGDPDVRHALLLQKRTVLSFETLLDHISEVMRFPVLKLHTPDGRRLDGLSSLILCSGLLVAAGREPFRKGNYDVQKPSAPARPPVKRIGTQRPMLRKKTLMSGSTKSPFSAASEHYIVSQIHKSFAEGACDPPGSVEGKTGQLLESVAETDAVTCLEDREGDETIQVPTNEDIEKSFRINQDGSMTVEMKVRLTLKEEETIKWTTTLSRASIASQAKCILESPSDLSVSLTDQNPADVDAVPSDIIQNCLGDHSEFSNKGHEVKDVVRAERNMSGNESVTSVLGWDQLEQNELSTARKLTEAESKENGVGSRGYREERRNGGTKQECCVLEQDSSRPVPTPRTPFTTELNTFTSQQRSTYYKPPEITRDVDELVHETTIHVYEQQVCQENFFANTQLCIQGMGSCGSETSDTIVPAMSNKTVPSRSENMRSEAQTSTTNETVHRQENLHTSCNNNIIQELRSTGSRICSPVAEFVKPSASRNPSMADTSKRRKVVRVIVKKNHIFQSSASEIKRKDKDADVLKEIKKIRTDFFKQAGALRLSERYRGKAAQKLLKRRNHSNGYENIPSVLPSVVQLKTQSLNKLAAEGEIHTREKRSPQVDLSSSKPNKDLMSLKKDLLHKEPDFHRETRELRESICLPDLHSSSSVFNEYLQLWLQKSEPNSHPEQGQMLPTKIKGSGITGETPGIRETSNQDNPLSPRNQLSKNKPSEQNVLLNDNSTEKNSIQTALSKNVCLKKAPFTNNATSENNSTSSETSELSKDQRNCRSLGKAITCTGSVKPSPFPRYPGSENTPLSQPLTDLIPQNNTLLKASLFSYKTEDKKTFHGKKSDPLHSGLNKGLKSLEKKSGRTQEDTSRHNTDKCPPLRMLSDEEMIEQPREVKTAVGRDVRHILKELDHSAQTLCELVQHRQQWSCVDKPNSLPDLSANMDTAFGSSSRIHTAFLSVMTLKDSLANLITQSHEEGDQSCSEALRLFQSLKEMAAIEDAEQLTESLKSLQNVLSAQQLESWRSFQELNYRSQGHSVMTDSSRSGVHSNIGSEEKIIQGVMDKLGVPDRVREELVDFCTREEQSNRRNQVEGSEEVKKSLSEVKVSRFLTRVSGEKTIREEREEVDVKHKRNHGLDEEEYVLKKNTEYPNTLDYIAAHETVETTINGRERTTSEDSELPGNSENKVTASGEGKFSLGSRIDEAMGFPEDRINDEGNLQMHTATVTGIDQKDSAQKALDHLQNEDPISESQSQPHSETYCVEHSEQSKIPATFLSTHVESCMKEEETPPETEQEQMIYEEELVYSEEEQVVLDTQGCFAIDQDHFGEQPEYGPDKAAYDSDENTQHIIGKKTKSNSVSELIANLELAAQRVSNTPVKTVLEESESDDLTNDARILNETDRTEVPLKSASPKVQTRNRKDTPRISPQESLKVTRRTELSHIPMTSEHLSSLVFSYDSPGSATAQEHEKDIQINRVKSIREMFLAKSNSRKQNAKGCSHSSNSDLSDYHPCSSDSGGNHSQTSPETCSGEDDASRLAIAKGFVRKTIERLYGKSHSDGTTDVKRPVSTSKGKRRDPGRTQVNNSTSFYKVCTREVADLSYFNATSSSEAFKEPTHCVNPNSQMEPGDDILIDKGHWLPCENQSIYQLSPELQDTPKKETKIATTAVTPAQDAIKEDVPYSLFCPASPHRSLPSTEVEELSGSSGPKFTYFNLPNASDSELELEERKSHTLEKAEVKVSPVTQPPKSWETLNSFLPAFRPPVVKKTDNKVHPSIEDVGPVVIQPGRGQSAQTEIIRHSTDSDLLETLFMFCGQHCPIL